MVRAPLLTETIMQLYLVRHGIAEEGGEGMPDGFRALTDRGRRRFQNAARAFGKLGHKLDLILTSPLVRAVQTAEILAGATRHREVAVLEQLDPKFDVGELRAAVENRAGRSTTVALVGHEPQLSSFLAALTGVSQGDIDLKKGAIVRVDAAALGDPSGVVVRWWLKPKRGAQVKGLPLQKQAAKASDGDGARRSAGKKANRRKRAVAPVSDAETPPTEAGDVATP
jgi:phosphohistidine phosphatase